MIPLITNRIDDILALCKSHKVSTLSVFGSAAKNTMTSNSDVDFLVQFSEDVDVLDYADNYFSFLEALEKIVVVKVDLVSLKSLRNPVLKDEINKSKIDLYAA